MNTPEDIQNKIITKAQSLHHYNELLLKQCDSWLSEEEGLKNVEKKIKRKDFFIISLKFLLL